jgi:hypothetical protein
MNIKIEKGAKVQITDKPIVNVYGDVVQKNEFHIHPVNYQQESDDVEYEEVKDETTSVTSPNKAIRRCLENLMQERITVKKGGKDVEEFLFNRQNHWQGVYRILVDKKFCRDSDFEGFNTFIVKVMPEKVNKPYKKDSVKQISKTDFNIPFEKWKYDGETSGNRKVYERMYAVAKRFKELLEEEGL